jgi:hypothetical protein
MRLLVVTHHFFEAGSGDAATVFSSLIDPLARIAAVNAMLIGFHRHFGPRRHGADPTRRLPEDQTPERVLDIVVLQKPGKGIIEYAGLDPSLYTLELWDGPDMQLGFETHRVLRERLGQYDYYAVVEDDMVIHDPLFFEKLAGFEQQFGTTRLLQPRRYEMAQSGTPAIVSAWPTISPKDMRALGMRRDGQAERLTGNWHGRSQSFTQPINPHVGGFFLSDAQLRYWASTPWLYDRDSSFVGPLESAMTLAICRAFDVYQPAAPDPFFLSIEHWGTRYARAFAPPGVTYGDTPLLGIAHDALRHRSVDEAASADAQRADGILGVMATADRQLNALVHERDTILHELVSLRHSRSKLLKALLKSTLTRILQSRAMP